MSHPPELLAPVLVGSKVRVPEWRIQTIQRQSLVQRLRYHKGHTLLVAPPGFGKSMLLAGWAHVEDRRVAWLSADETDNDPVVLWSGVITAVREADPAPIPAESLPLAGSDLTKGPIPRILNAIEADGKPLVLVVDDYHRITNPSAHATIEFVLDHAPPNLTLMIASRTLPSLPVGRLRATGDFLELGSGDLSFTLEETSRLLNGVLGLGLSERALAILHSRTEGWPAGVYLAYLSLRESEEREAFIEEFSGSNRLVADYLTEVVLNSLDEGTRGFLLATSILEHLTGPLCDLITGRDDSAAFLAKLERSNLFLIPMDDRREWYRYHRLFSELLTDALQQNDPAHVPELHRRAMSWFADSGDQNLAIHHAIAAGDLDAAALLVCEHYAATIEWGGVETVARWLDTFPRERVVGDARLCIVEAWVMSFLNRREDAEVALEHAAALDYDGPLPDGASSIESSIAFVRAGFPWDNVGDMLAAARHAHRLQHRQEGSMVWRVTVHMELGLALCLAGRFREAQPSLELAAGLAVTAEQWLNVYGAFCCLAWVSLEAGDLDEAEHRARSAVGVAEAHHLDHTPPGGWGYTMLGMILGRAGQSREADEYLSRGIDLLRLGGQPILLIQALAARATVRRAVGSIADARMLVSEARAMLRAFSDAGVVAELVEDASHLVARAASTDATRDLSVRELEIVQLLEKGLSKREIAQTLFLSFNTIHTHMRSIYRKLGVSSREEGIALARERGLI